MDLDDFMKLLAAFNERGIHFAWEERKRRAKKSCRFKLSSIFMKQMFANSDVYKRKWALILTVVKFKK